MSKKEIKALRRPYIKELFRKNRFNLVMTVFASLFGAAAELVISWLIKEVADLISGECPYSFSTLLIVAGGALQHAADRRGRRIRAVRSGMVPGQGLPLRVPGKSHEAVSGIRV